MSTAQTYKDSLPRLRAPFHWPGPSERSPIGHRSEGCPTATTCNPKRLHTCKEQSACQLVQRRKEPVLEPLRAAKTLDSDNCTSRKEEAHGRMQEAINTPPEYPRASPGLDSQIVNQFIGRGPRAPSRVNTNLTESPH